MVPDIDAALKFYRDLLGFRITDFMGPPVSLYFMHVNTRHHSLAIHRCEQSPRRNAASRYAVRGKRRSNLTSPIRPKITAAMTGLGNLKNASNTPTTSR
jgi:catechol 2,3-dioxygenase-like lactoylglutathione lyase family enzyme